MTPVAVSAVDCFPWCPLLQHLCSDITVPLVRECFRPYCCDVRIYKCLFRYVSKLWKLLGLILVPQAAVNVRKQMTWLSKMYTQNRALQPHPEFTTPERRWIQYIWATESTLISLNTNLRETLHHRHFTNGHMWKSILWKQRLAGSTHLSSPRSSSR